MPHTYPHIPLGASPRFLGKSANGLYGDVVEELDWSVGEIMSALKKHGLERNTIVLFSSDNGPWFQGSPGRLRGRKGSTYEGGVREPFLARWTGQIPKAPSAMEWRDQSIFCLPWPISVEQRHSFPSRRQRGHVPPSLDTCHFAPVVGYG